MIVPSRGFAKIGTPSFVSDKGWRGTSATAPALASVLNTGYTPDASILGSDSFAMLVCCADNLASNDADFGCGSTFRLSVRNTANKMSARVGTTTTVQSTDTTPTSIGSFLCNRFNGSATFYTAAGDLGSAVTADSPSALPTTPLTLGVVNSASSGRIIRAAALLRGFDPATESMQITALLTAFQACFAAIDAL